MRDAIPVDELFADFTATSEEECQESRKGLYSFVSATLQGLREREQVRRPGASSLDCLARVDVGIIPGAKGGWDYFVNEVERGICVALFSYMPDIPSEQLMESMGTFLVKYLDS